MPETPEPPPAAPRTRNQVLAIGAILLAAAVPIALAFGVDVCTPLRARVDAVHGRRGFAVSGWPLRPDRDSFGPEVENSAPVRDSRRQWDASIANLVMHQCAGMGLVSPRTALVFSAQIGPVVLGRVEAWNPHRLTAAPLADPAITRTGAGNYLVAYTTPVPDERGVDQAVSFQWAPIRRCSGTRRRRSTRRRIECACAYSTARTRSSTAAPSC
jgi:hypothetical protein